MSYRPSPLAHVAHTRVDVSLLSLTDRACLRLLEYSRVCTASQLATLIYPSLRTALRRTRKLYQSNLITRESLPPDRGGIPLAYRLSSSGRRRIHLNAYRSPGLITTRHSLDGVEFVASLVRHDPGLVHLWWPEYDIPDWDWGVNPDHLVVIDTGEASAFILVEVDESTERPPVIRDRLEAYAKLFEDHRSGWHLLWVVNSRERLARLRQIAGPTKHPILSGRCWGVAIDDVVDQGADAEVVAIGAKDPPRPLRRIATDPMARRSEYEVGSNAWIGMLANGGKQDIGPLWHGVERIAPEPEPAVIDRGVFETEAASSDDVEAQPPESPASPPDAAPLFDLEDMTSGELFGLITARNRDTKQAQDAAQVIVDRGEWTDLYDAAEILCRSPHSHDQLFGLSLVRQHQALDRNFRQASGALVRDLARYAEPGVAAHAQAVLEEMVAGD